MSLLDENTDGLDKYAADYGDAYIGPMLSRPAGFRTNWNAIFHPLGIFKIDDFSSQGNYDALADKSRQRTGEEDDRPAGLFKLQPVGVQTDATVINSEGTGIAEMQDYAKNPLRADVENDGNIQFLREVNGVYQLRSSNVNQHGVYLQKHFQSAMSAGDAEALRALLQYVKFAYREDIEVDYENVDLEGNTPRTQALVDFIKPSRSASVSLSEDQEEQLAALQ